MRLIHAVQDLNQEHSCGLRTIALYTLPDQHSLFVREADEAWCLGSALFTDPADGCTKSRYLDLEAVASALLETRAEAVWVGWGFLSERPEFADLVRELGIVFVGPDGDVMRRLGDKIASKRLAEQVGVPVADWSRGPVEGLDEAQVHAARLGFPLLIKATAGGGGRGIRRVKTEAELSSLLANARAEALKAFGDGTVFLEQLVNKARHVEVQILADQHGAVWAVGVRDCTLQRRNQKVLEEAPCHLLSPELEQSLREAAVRLARAAGYQNAGTAEFLLDPVTGRFYFMEMNTRLQVEHPVTEVTTGLDLVQCQLQIADGQPLLGDPPRTNGHAIEVRLNAEDPDQGFSPAPGRIVLQRLPTGSNVRVDTGVAMGDSIASEFDSMIAKVIVWGKTREEALGRMRRVLSELVTVIDGGRTNKAFLLELLRHRDVCENHTDIQWLDRTWEEHQQSARPHAEVALAEAAIRVYEQTLDVRRQDFRASALRGRITLPREAGCQVELRYAGHSYSLQVNQLSQGQFQLFLNGTSLELTLESLSRYERQARCNGTLYRLVTSLQGTTFLIEVNGVVHKVSHDAGGSVLSASPGVILAVHVKVGDAVASGQSLLVMEAMKMETSVTAPFAGTVRTLSVTQGQYVPAGSPLLVLEPGAASMAAGSAAVEEDKVIFPDGAASQDLETLGRRVLRELRHYVLGYEVPPESLASLLRRWVDPTNANQAETRLRGAHISPWHTLLGTAFLRAGAKLDGVLAGTPGNTQSTAETAGGRPSANAPTPGELVDLAAAGLARAAAMVRQQPPALESGRHPSLGLRYSIHKVEALLQLEDEVLAIVADILDLFERRPHGSREQGPSRSECLLSIVHSLDPEDERLPSAFLDKLRRVAAWYGVDRLKAGDAQLLEVLMRAHQGHRQLRDHPELIELLLQSRLESLDTLAPFASDSQRALLLRLNDATHDPLGQLSELARLLHYRQFEAQSRSLSQASEGWELQKALDALLTEKDPRARQASLLRLLDWPNPLDRMLWQRFEQPGDSETRLQAFELLARRSTHLPLAEGVATTMGPALFQLHCPETGTVLGASCTREHLLPTLHTLAAHPAKALCEGGERCRTVLLSVAWDELADAEELAAPLRVALNAVRFPAMPERMGIRVQLPDHQGSAQLFTFESDSDASFVEAVHYRNVSLALQERLELNRLTAFLLERLPSDDSCFLFRGVARKNPKDERLFCHLEVESLAVERDASGRLLRIPGLERRLLPALDAMRQFLISHSAHPLEWNRLTLAAPVEAGIQQDVLDHLLAECAPRLAALIPDSGVDQVCLRASSLQPDGSRLVRVLELALNRGSLQEQQVRGPITDPIVPLTAYARTVARMRRRGLTHPYEIIRLMTPSADSSMTRIPHGTFQELDLNEQGGLMPVSRPYGENTANVVVGIIRNFSPGHPEGMERILLLGDASRDMGALAEPECRRILAALDLARERSCPLEWFPVSSGARIAMESGTENLDWTAAVLRKLIEFTQSGGEVNLVVDGVSVGAQSYWNAEATMLMHTRGILIMTPSGSMVLTGKRALEYSGSVSAETHEGIGGVEHIMGPNGEAQYIARDIPQACQLLIQYYQVAYRQAGERFPRSLPTCDPAIRDVCLSPIPSRGSDSGGFGRIGEIFGRTSNPGRKQPFPIRPVMRAVSDTDWEPLERWALWRDAETAVVWDTRLGGHSVTLLGIESRSTARAGFVPADGPDSWSGGTLYPNSSRKMARAINAASGSRPVVVLANLSGFDGSPESMRRMQLEYGAELGRAVVNFQGPLIFCVISRFHGGAYVVFSRSLNPNLTLLALEGSYASVIGGAPAAAVVFPGEVKARTRADHRIVALREALAKADLEEKTRLSMALDQRYAEVHAEHLSQLAEEFDTIHSVERAKRVGSLHDIISPDQLRAHLIATLERNRVDQADATREVQSS